MSFFKHRWGRVCKDCDSRFSILIRYDKIVEGKNEGQVEYSYLSSLCNCSVGFFYRNGARVIYSNKNYDEFFKWKKIYEKCKALEDSNKIVNSDIVSMIAGGSNV